MPEWSKPAIAEATGTFALVFVGVLAIAGGEMAGQPGATSLVGVAFAHGLTIAVMVAALGAVSGGHFNPAVTLGFVVTGRLPVRRGAIYWAAQLAGAALAGYLITAMFGHHPATVGTPQLAEGVNPLNAIFLEAVATAFLVLVVFGTAVDQRAPRAVFPLAIGLTITLGILAIGPLTGGALNPARAFGSALPVLHWGNHVIYWVGPLLGGALGAGLYETLLMERAPSPAVAQRGGPAPAEQRTTSS